MFGGVSRFHFSGKLRYTIFFNIKYLEELIAKYIVIYVLWAASFIIFYDF